MPDLCLCDERPQTCVRQPRDIAIHDVKPYLAIPTRESPPPQTDQLSTTAELRDRLLQDDFLAQLSEDVLKSFSISEMRGKRRAESLASQVYRIQQRILDDSDHSDPRDHGCASGQVPPLRSSSHRKESQKRNHNKFFASPEVSASSHSNSSPIFAGEFDTRLKQLQMEQSQRQKTQDTHLLWSSPTNATKCNTLAELAATSSVAETASLCATLRDTKSDLDLHGMLENLHRDRDILKRTIAKTPNEVNSRGKLLKTQLRDNEKLTQACLMALQQRSQELKDSHISADQYLKSYLSRSHNNIAALPSKCSAPKITAAIRPSTASVSHRGERLVPEYVVSAIRDPITTPTSSSCAPNDLYSQPSSALFPILAQSRLRQSMHQDQKPFGEGCAYLPSKDTIVPEQSTQESTNTYNNQVENSDKGCAPMFSNCTVSPITHTNAMQIHALMFSPHAMKAFTTGSNVIKLVCPDALTLSQNSCRYIGNIVEPLLLIGNTVINVSSIHTLKERLAKCFFYEPDGLLISPMERNFVWATLCFVLYKHPDAIFIPRSGNLLQTAQFILPFDVALKPTHVLLEVSIIAPSLPLKSYAIANVAVPYFNDRPALPRATRIEAISKYQRRVYFSIDRMRFALNKAARVVATYLRKTTDVLE
ncbi:Hypothetical protein GLP15_4759 [Giardia lamblia P15]|uniref:Uncharacterized protein n=1 Tax=Giardia intestinalis (strain P15) TaxID=658858 RepID=E1F4H6_GIAIA|nr:Hypothetical protein GLP15_4759 [Giardia lamblia P15]